ncbi:MAG: glycoside hydrolase family 28 protein [Spirochaetales bacterium]|nr:glycoside hydrolase family 28 protein [Candidatus Physcosoma equi]
MDKFALKAEILNSIKRPEIPSFSINASEFGIVPNTEEILTERIQKAIDELSSRGGGKLVFSSGVYRTGSLFLKSHVEVNLSQKDTVLSFVFEDLEKNYPVRFCHWEASPCYNYSALIYSYGETDIALTGQGTLDGGADENHWWNFHHQVETSWSTNDVDKQKKARGELRKMNQNGVPVEERVFGDGHYLRPNFIQPIKCERVLLSGFSLRHSPMWQLNPVMCKSVTIENLDINSHGPNNDGCDPESCDGVIIKGCRFDTGDDCISLKSGRDRDGRVANVPCRNVYIEDNDFADGHGGVALGSEMSGGIYRVYATNNRFSSPNLTYALRMKTNAKRGGTIEDVVLSDSRMDSVHGAAVHGTMLYEDGRQGTDLPHFRNIRIENVTAFGGDYGIFLEAFPEVPITGLELENVTIEGAEKALRSMNWENAKVSNVRINGKLFPRPGFVRILGTPSIGEEVEASAENCGGNDTASFTYLWEGDDGSNWKVLGEGKKLLVPSGYQKIRVTAQDEKGEKESSIAYLVVKKTGWGENVDRLLSRGVVLEKEPCDEPITRHRLAILLLALADKNKTSTLEDTEDSADQIAAGNKFLPVGKDKLFHPEETVTREVMATVTMQACGVNYRNASSTMPDCADKKDVQNNYGTNVYRSLYFGFMETDENNNFRPKELVTERDAVNMLTKVADFYGL